MNLLESLLYGLISGLAEFLPISSQAHQSIVLQIFGLRQRDPLLDLLAHIAMIAALYFGNQALISRLARERQLSTQLRRSRSRSAAIRAQYDIRLIRSAALPMLAVLLLYFATNSMEFQPVYVCLFLVINGIILLTADHMRQGNKDARTMSGFDGMLMGTVSALSALPGISRIGTCISVSTGRGADRQHSINWALLLSVPALILFVIFDFVSLIRIGVSGISFLVILGYLIAALASFLASYLGILLIRLVAERAGFAAFAYYSWGAALFTFILYLIT